MMKSSVFVRIDKYREVYGIVNQIKSKLEEAKQVLKKIKDLKSQEDAELAIWQNELETVEHKLAAISGAVTKQ